MASVGCWIAAPVRRRVGFAWPLATPPRDSTAVPSRSGLLQTAMLAMLLLLLWQPALSVATLRPQQNIVAVLWTTRAAWRPVGRRFVAHGSGRGSPQRSSRIAGEEISSSTLPCRRVVWTAWIAPTQLNAKAPATRLGDGLKQVTSEAASLPIGAVVLLSDGADNSGGIDLETSSEIRDTGFRSIRLASAARSRAMMSNLWTPRFPRGFWRIRN